MKTLSEKAMLVTLTIGMFAPRKTDRRVTHETNTAHNTDSRAGRYIKNLLPEQSIQPITKLASEIRAYNLSNTLPWLNDGTRMLPAAKWCDYTTQIRAYRSRWDEAVSRFINDYSTYVEEAKVILNGMFNADDYPPADEVRRKFVFRTTTLPLPDCQDFRVGLVNGELAEIQAEMSERLAEVREEARRELHSRIMEPVARMAERLSKSDAVFRDTLVENIREIVMVIPDLNIDNDPALTSLSDAAKELIVDPQTLRDNPMVRSVVADKAAALLERMKSYA